MSRRNARLLLQDMLESLEKIERYTTGLTFERFAWDDRTVDAVVRNLEIIGEAAQQIPSEVRERYPEVPWRRVIGLRNVVVHEYFAVDVEIVWTVVRQSLPELSARALVSQHGVPKSGLWKGFSGAPAVARATAGYLKEALRRMMAELGQA